MQKLRLKKKTYAVLKIKQPRNHCLYSLATKRLISSELPPNDQCLQYQCFQTDTDVFNKASKTLFLQYCLQTTDELSIASKTKDVFSIVSKLSMSSV